MAPVVQAQIRWSASVDELKQNLAQGIGVVDAMKTSVDRTVQSLSGNGLLQAANRTAAAIQEMGGVTRLTGAEQERINDLMDRAIEKYSALGLQAPPALQQIRDATKDAADETSQFGGLVERLTERFAIYAVLHEVLDFTKELFADAAALEDLSKATGISTDDLQRLSYISEEFGVDAETMARGVEQLSAKLANGDKNATSAVQMLGLSIDDLLKAGPKEAFLDIGEALGRVQDPMEKAGLAAELFGGRLSKELVPMLGDLRQKMNDVPQTAIISEETIQSAHDFDVALSHLWTTFKAVTVQTFTGLRDGTTLMAAGFMNLGGAIAASTGAVQAHKQALDENLPAQDAVLDRTTLLHNKIRALKDEALVPLDSQQKANILTLKSYGEGLDEIAKDVGSNTVAVKLFLDAHKAAEDQAKKDAEAMKKLAEEVDNLSSKMKVQSGVSQELLDALTGLSKGAIDAYDKIIGAKQTQQADDLAAAFDYLNTRAFPPTAQQLKNVADMAGELLKKGADLNPALVDLAVSFGELDPKMEAPSKLIEEFGTKVKLTIPDVPKLKDGLVELAKTFDALGSAMKAISPLAGEVITDFGHMTSAIDGAEKSFAAASKAFSTPGGMLAGIENLASGIGGIVTAAVDAGKAIDGLWNHFFGTAGRDAVVQFAQTFGGFDQLHAKLDAVGAAGEQLWIKLTQGVGRNNPQQAQEVIGQINALFQGQSDYLARLPQEMQQYGLTWEQAGKQAEQSHLDSIGANLVQTFDDLTRAGFNVDDVTTKMSGDLNAYVDEAIDTGTEVPAAMKPILQHMIDLGTLTDSAGNKITDLGSSGINFSETLTEGFNSVVDALDRIAKALGATTDQINNIPRNVDVNVNYHENGKPSDNSGDTGAAGAATGGYVGKGRVLAFPFALGGPVFQPIGTDTVPAMLTPGEIVINAAQQRNLAGALAGGGDVAQLARQVELLRRQVEQQHLQLMTLPGTIARASRDAALLAAA